MAGYIFSPLGYTIQGSPNRFIQNNIDITRNMPAAGCIVLRCADVDEALLLARLYPILDFEGAVEVRERMPQPQQAIVTFQQ